MDEMSKRTDYLEHIRNQLLVVNSVEGLITVLKDMSGVPIALSTIEDVTDGTGMNMSMSVVCSEVRMVNRIMCLMSDDMFTSVQMNLDMIKSIHTKVSVDGKGVVMKLGLKNGVEFLLMFHTDAEESL